MGKPTSIITNNLEVCYLCGRRAVDIHHIFGAANRKWSEKYHLVIGLCRECHNFIHSGGDGAKCRKKVQMMAQSRFEETYKDLNFREIFGRNYK